MKNGRFNFVSIKTILSKFYRDLKDTSIEEVDLIEWIGEAMGFMRSPQILEEAVAFLEVEDNQTILPNGFQAIIQVAKNNNFVKKETCGCDNECYCETTTERDKVCEEIKTPKVPSSLIGENTATFGSNIDNVLLTVGPIDTNGKYTLILNSRTNTLIVSDLLKSNFLAIDSCYIYNNVASNLNTGTFNILSNTLNTIVLNNVSTSFINCLVSQGTIINNITGTTANVRGDFVTLQYAYEDFDLSYKQLIRLRQYSKNFLIETNYQDCNGNAYQLTGTIVNCPANVCLPCNSFDNEVAIYDECGKKITETTYRKYFSIKNSFYSWVNSRSYKQDYTPIRLSQHIFFNSVVCKLSNNIYNDPDYYPSTGDEYTVVGDYPNMALRFSFEKGQVALAYLKMQTDEEGLPLIPDDTDCHSALGYYLKWKIAERLAWNGREGYARLAQDSELHWLRYVKQFKSKSKMPYTIDDYQDLQENSYYLIPIHNKSFGFFGQIHK